jgi:acyl transferase domain-containing protein/acyl carrier protein/SAM-dependent methyltransferase
MLEVLNRFGHGFVGIPAVLAVRSRGLWANAVVSPCSLADLAARCGGANPGHLRVVLRQLESLGIVSREPGELYRIATIRNFPQISPKLLDFYESDPAFLLTQDCSRRLPSFVEQMLRRWDAGDPWADLLDGCILVPLLLALAPRLKAGATVDLSGLAPSTATAIQQLFAARNWGLPSAAGASNIHTSPSGRFLLERAPILATVFSYGPMLARMDELLFGNARNVFLRDADGHETHIDRNRNVTGSGFQHEKFFSHMEEIIVEIFSRQPLGAQPRYIADMGCGDGTLLRRIHDIVLRHTPRGPALDQFPLTLIGLDYNQKALDETARTLQGLPHLLLRADIGRPRDIASTFAHLAINAEDVLHVRSFLDHDRPFIPPSNNERTHLRSRIPSEAVSVDERGGLIEPGLVVESLVRHLENWSAVVNRHGLVLLEVHSLAPAMVRRFRDESESLHFDAYHGFSGQHLVEAHVFRLALAEAGLFPRPGFSQRFPRAFPFTRITLDWLEKRDYRVRHAVPADLPQLLQLDAACWPEPLRVPHTEWQSRLDRFPEGQFVLEIEGRLVAALSSQRVASVQALETARFDTLAAMHSPDGPVLQLLGLNVSPEWGSQSLGAQLADVVFDWCRLRGDIEAVAGLTRCKDFPTSGEASYSAWVHRSDNGLPADPILKFHAGRGARIRAIVPGYRPEDTDNLGHGVLIEYSLQQERPTNEAVQQRPADALAAVEAGVRRFLRHSAGAYSPDAPLREMGFDSLDLMELRVTLGREFAVELDASFFFEYSTPRAIARHLSATPHPEPASESALPTPATHIPTSDDPIAIIGMACRFPGGVDSPESFWNLLLQGQAATGPVPASRAPLTGHGGFLSAIDQFDAAFFRIAPREANFLDPQQRLLLEESWRALENAGIDPGSLAGSRTGVFTGLFSHDYETLTLRQAAPGVAQPYLATGNAAAVASGRLAYFLDLRGPALTIDTACSSSLVAVHLAAESLRRGECTLALAGGVNLILTPDLTETFRHAGMLAPDGRCKTFDASADGYVRSEGCAVVVLKPLSRALADGDEVLAIIRGSAINQDGASNGLTAPNAQAQEAVIRDAITAAGCRPADVSYVEAHGTGTALGDPVETKALCVYGEGRAPAHPLLLGSVKTNIGHTEAAAGLAGLLKVVLALRHRRLPRHLHFTRLNDGIALDRIPARIPLETEEWLPGPAGRLLAGISSFGFSGTNAHVILEEAPPVPRDTSSRNDYQILALSAGSEAGLQATTQAYARYLESHPEAPLPDLCHTANAGRRHFAHRFTAIASDRAGLLDSLRRLGPAAPSVDTEPQVVFLFTGQGSQYAGMGRDLYRTSAVFREAIDRCDALLRPNLNESLIHLLFHAEGNLLAETRYTQPALFAIGYALTELWRSLGITPAAVAGHSAGEFAAAVAAGILSLEDGLSLITERARLMHQAPRGAMLAVLTDLATVEAALHGVESEVAIAVHNAPRNIVISGVESRIAELDRHFQSAGIRTIRLNVSHAFHSPLMDSAIDPLASAASGVKHRPPLVPFVSNRSGGFLTEMQPDYWAGHLRHAVHFAEGIETLIAAGYRTFLEIGPRPTLIDLARQCAPDTAAITWLASLRPGRSDRRQLLESVGDLYRAGAAIHWQAVAQPGARRVSGLPGYPFERQRYWLPAPAHATTGTLLGNRLRSAVTDEQFQTTWDPTRFSGHQVEGQPLTPAAAYLTLAQQAAGEPTLVTNLEIEQPLALQSPVLLQTTLTESRRLSIHSYDEAAQQWRRHATAVLAQPTATAHSEPLAALRERLQTPRPPAMFYQQCAQAGLCYSGPYQAIQELYTSDQEALALIHAGSDPVSTLDTALQVALAALPNGFAPGLPLPVEAQRTQFRLPLPATFWSHASLRLDEPRRAVTANLTLYDDQTGAVLGSIQAFTLRFRATQDPQRWQDWLCRVVWQPQPLPTRIDPGSFAEAASAVNALARDVLHHSLSLVNGDAVHARHQPVYQRLQAHAGGAPASSDPAALFQLARNRYPEAAPELTLLERCASNLRPVLEGWCDPLELLFPNGDVSDCRRLYTESPAFAAMNQLLSDTVAGLVETRGAHRRVRILEIGGGTASATAAILPNLDPNTTAYTFTDVSSLFPTLAAEQFRDYPFFTGRTLDIEKPPAQQGFEPQSFDLIVASNVLHATADLAVSLRHARELLAPGGALVMLEVTEPQPWIDLVFGLTEGWWRFRDHQTRPDYPLLSCQRWRKVLAAEGFASVSVHQPGASDAVYSQAVLVAHTTNIATRKWVVAGDAQPLTTSLLSLLGDTAEPIAPGSLLQSNAAALICVQPDWQTLLDVVQTLANVPHPHKPRLWVITRDAVAVLPNDAVHGVNESPAWGMARVIAREHPELRCRLVDLDHTPESLAALWNECRYSAASTEEVAFRNGERYVARLTRWDPAPEASFDLPAPITHRIAPAPGEVEIRVAATGLNFRDVLSATGQYPGGPVPLGVECAGTVERTGAGVDGLTPGQPVIAIAPGCFGEFAIARAALVVPKPANLSFSEGAGITIPFLTAAYALEHVAQLKPGSRVLIHAAAGGVGFAACQIARLLGAEVHATASPSKWTFLREQGIQHLYDSRSIAFASQVRGVDVVLNSLSGELARLSYDLLREPGGLYIELAKNSPLDGAPACRAFDLLEVAANQPDLIRALWLRVLARIEQGELQPLPLSIYPASQMARAFHTMQHAQHIGKIVVSRTRLDPQGTYLVTGGTGGLGLEVATWLVEQGARRLVLVSRRGPGPIAAETAAALRQSGAEVIFARADAGNRHELAAVLTEVRRSGSPLRGVIHAAGVLEDGLLVDQTPARFRTVLDPKANAAWHLHELTRPDRLELFVLFSSIASIIGSPGQGNHAAANAFLDSLAAYRRARGLPGLTINWGAWSEIGAAAGSQTGHHLRLKGLESMTPKEGIAAFHLLLDTQPVQAGVLPVNWNAFLERHGSTPFFAPLRTTVTAPKAPVAAITTADPVSALREQLREMLRTVLGLPQGTAISARRGFFELGLDSLGSVELRNKLQKQLDRSLPSSLLFDYPNLDALTAHLLEEVLFPDTPAPVPIAAHSAPTDIDTLTDEEAEQALLERLEQIESV